MYQSLVFLSLLSGCIEDTSTTSNYEYDLVYPEPKSPYDTGDYYDYDYGIVYPNSRPIYDIPENYNNMVEIQMEGMSLKCKILGYYETTDSVQEVLNWYINKFTAQGYYIAEHIPSMRISNPSGVYEYGYVVFGKGDYGIGVWALRDLGEGRTIFWIGEIIIE